jgi:hypothetical protein
MENEKTFYQEFSEQYNVPQKVVIEMESSYLTLCGLAHDLNKIIILQLLTSYGWERDEIYKRCNDDLQALKEMFISISFINEMISRGYNETKRYENAMWGMVYYFENL